MRWLKVQGKVNGVWLSAMTRSCSEAKRSYVAWTRMSLPLAMTQAIAPNVVELPNLSFIAGLGLESQDANWPIPSCYSSSWTV